MNLLRAFLKAWCQLRDPAVLGVLWWSFVAAFVVFAALWSGLVYLVAKTTVFAIGWLETVVDALGGLAALVLAWVLFPGVIAAVASLFLERVARAVEALHYPLLPAPTPPPAWESAWTALRFLAVFLALDTLLLPFLLIPPVFPFVFYAVNGYLLGREYFEQVASRRLRARAVSSLRKSRRLSIFAAGLLIAVLLTVPVVNLLAPMVATAAMIHLFHGWRSQREAT